MRLPDNSDSACLIKADWLEDHGLADDAQSLRDEVAEGQNVSGVDFGSAGDFGGVGVSGFGSEVGGGGVGRADGIGIGGDSVGGFGGVRGGVVGGGVGSSSVGGVDGRWHR